MARLVGVFGGTFDPPHIGHVILAEEGRIALGLEQVLWVVTADPPHKPGRPISPVSVRLEMVAAAIEGNRRFQLSLADVERPGPQYSVDTMKWLRKSRPADNYAYLMGSDSLKGLPAWHRPLEFLARCDLIGVFMRPGASIELKDLEAKLPGLSSKIQLVASAFISISAQEIRQRVHEGEPYRHLVPEPVAQIIEAKGLYR